MPAQAARGAQSNEESEGKLMGLKEEAAGKLTTSTAADLTHNDQSLGLVQDPGKFVICTAAGAIEMDLSAIPRQLWPLARAWSIRRSRELAHVHGQAWPAHRWLLRQLHAEFRDQFARKAVRA